MHGYGASVDDAIGIGTDPSVGGASKDSIVDSEKFKRVLEEDGVDSIRRRSASPSSTCPA